MEENQDIFEMRLDGGNLSLNFVNTIHDRYEEPFKDYLHHYLDLITWANFADAINSAQKKKLLQISQENQGGAKLVYKESIQLREAIYGYIVSFLNQDEIPSPILQLINQWLSRAFSNLELNRVDRDCVLDWNPENFGLESVLWPIIKSFADLITSDARNRIKLCSNCGWVFVDNSKNNSRRWCSMETCGNRLKARRYAIKTRT
jgi:predicted RNA-binding Zn ribbon-like protein